MVTALLVPTIASAADFELSLGAAAEYDSNVYRVSNDSERSKKDDVVFRIVPAANLISDEGAFTYRLRYSVPFEQGVDSNRDISNFDQIGRVEVGYRLNEATQFYANDVIRYTRSYSRPNQQQDAEGQFIPDVNTKRARVLRNLGEIGLTHSFEPRLAGSLRLSHALFDTQQNNRANNWTLNGTGALNYQLDPKNTLGGGASITYQTFDKTTGLPGSESLFYNIFLSWVWRLDETTTITLSGGPVIITVNQDNPPNTVSDFDTYPYTVIEKKNGQPTKIGVSSFLNCPPLVDESGTPVPGRGTLTLVGGDSPGCGSLSSQGILDVNSSNPDEVADFMTVVNSASTLTFPAGTKARSTDDTTVSGFGLISINKRWSPTLASDVSYRRQQSAASGIGGSTIMDAVAFTTSWEISELWDAAVRFDWTQRKSVSSLAQTTAVVCPAGGADDPELMDMCPPALLTLTPVAATTGQLTNSIANSKVNTQRWGVGMRLSRKITHNLEASLRLNYNKQDSKTRTRGKASDFDDYLAIIGIRYSFNPLELW